MTEKEFLNHISKSREDVILRVLNYLNKLKIDYCVIGGLAVNAYTEPVVSLDLDLVIVASNLNRFLEAMHESFTIQEFTQSINLTSSKSSLRL